MTLEEAIKHCEEVAEEKEREAEYRQETQGDMFKFLDDLSKSVGGEGIENDALNECLECAKDHRQLAEWLRELKAYRKAKKKIIENMKAWEKIFNEPLEWNVEDINSIKLAFYQDGKADAYTDCIGICEIAFEEVNADDNIQS